MLVFVDFGGPWRMRLIAYLGLAATGAAIDHPRDVLDRYEGTGGVALGHVRRVATSKLRGVERDL